MMRYIRTALILLACLFCVGRASAAGGTCPSGANYVSASTGSLVTLSALGVTTCYYVAASGSDANSGTSESNPWLHSPGMLKCTGTCASVTPAAGEGFIFRGGDTWHIGNSSLSPYTGMNPPQNPGCSHSCAIYLLQSGTATHPIYFGVDVNWFSGASWARPIFNGDNPTSISGVASCTYDQAESNFIEVDINSNYNVIDNFEMTGLCWHGNQANANEGICCSAYISNNSDTTVAERNYIHGWTHVTYSCSTSGGEPTGNCDGATAMQGAAIVTQNVIDGSDTDQRSICALCFTGNVIIGNYIGHLGNAIIANDGHILADNIIEYLSQSGDGQSHTNGFEFNREAAGTTAVYNNILRHIFVVGGGEIQQMAPNAGQTDYYFNNLLYALSTNGNLLDFCGGGGVGSGCGFSGGTINIFNNTWVMPDTGGGAGGPGAGSTANFINNHCILPGGGTCYPSQGGTVNNTTDTVQDPSTATSQGYTSSEIQAYSPISGGSTIGAGTNKSSFCAAMLGSSDVWVQQAGTACEFGTGYACIYNASNHTVSCPATPLISRPSTGTWDVGAYQFSGAQTQPPQPPGSSTTTVR